MTRDELIPFTAGDGRALELVHVRGDRAPSRRPVLLVHGAGVRANIFRAPSKGTLVDALVAEGWDVWLENWRASIDLEPCRWTLDDAALHDHPAAVREVLRLTGADEVRAVVHCQGSTSFTMSAVAGLLPDVSVVVSNAVSLHPVVPRLAAAKLRWVMPLGARQLGYLDPRWSARDAPGLLAKSIVAWVGLTHRECRNPVCRMASFTYGTGEPTLWRHENLNRATHDWLSDEFGLVPLSFFAQIERSVRAGHLVGVSASPQLPASLVGPPSTSARFAFFAGAQNACFTPESQRRSHAHFTHHGPDRGHTLHVLPGYGHLDVFMGAHASRDVFPTMLEELDRP